ncbi:unnamed protein product, partial [marine sediment metagenome]
GADLGGAHLEGADLTDARLEEANLASAHLERASLAFANLKGVNLAHAQLERAELLNANLEGADLWGAKLNLAYLEGTKWSPATQLEQVDWGQVGQEAEGEFETAERIYRSLEKWHGEHGIRDLASGFAYKKQRARRKAIGAETRRKFREALKWRG